MLAGYPKKPLLRSMLHKIREVIMVRVSTLKLIEYIFSYTIKESVGKKIPPKNIPSGTGDPPKKKICFKKKMINRYTREQEGH